MNEDRIVGAGRDMVGTVERTAGRATGDTDLEGRGIADQIVGTVQNSFGRITDGIREAANDLPGAVGGMASQARAAGRRADAALRDELGDNAPLYVLAGAVALLAVALIYAGRD